MDDARTSPMGGSRTEEFGELRDLVASVPGCDLRGIRRGARFTDIEMGGWSPSLHQAVIVRKVANPRDDGPGGCGRRIDRDGPRRRRVMRAVEKLAASQRARAEAGCSHGIHLPLTIPAQGGEGIATGHLLMDRSCIEAILGEAQADMRGAVEAKLLRDLGLLMRERIDHHDSVDRGGLVIDIEGNPRVRLTRRVRAGLTIGPASVVVCEAIPATTASLLVGRPLSDLVDLGPAFAGRTIADVVVHQASIHIALEPDDVRLADVYARFALDLS